MHKTEENFFTAADGIRLFYRILPCPGNSRGKIFIQHGIGEHSGRYMHMVDLFHNAGLDLFLLDARGHGKSEGKRGHADSIGAYAEDIDSFLKFLDLKDEKIFLMGHSMGALIVLHYAEFIRQDNIKALIVNAAGLDVPKTMNVRIKKFSGKIIRRFSPSFTLSTGLNAKDISHKKESVTDYVKDPLVHDQISASLGISLLEEGNLLRKYVSVINVPILITHGEADRIASCAGSRNYFNELTVQDKTLILYPDMYHEIYNETEDRQKKVFSDLSDWLGKHI